MPYGLKIALRYLTASKAQTGLLIAGVAVGVFVFVFISALIGGLGVFLVQRTVGDIAHVSIEAPSREAGSLLPGDAGSVLLVEQRATTHREQLRTAALTNTTVLIGSTLAHDLGLEVGQVVGLLSDRGIERSLLVGGIFELGLDALDSRAAFVSLAAARTLFELPQGVSRIELKLDDLNQADPYAKRIAADTGLEATPWTAGNAQLLSGLRAQVNSSNLIKAFALISIVIGVASALLLSTYRRRSEIGIMRAMGASRAFVVAVFVIQGALIGILGGLLGAGLGYLALSPFPVPELATTGDLPIDVRQGAYGLAIALTAIGAILASILPARAAARVDPVTVITQ